MGNGAWRLVCHRRADHVTRDIFARRWVSHVVFNFSRVGTSMQHSGSRGWPQPLLNLSTWVCFRLSVRAHFSLGPGMSHWARWHPQFHSARLCICLCRNTHETSSISLTRCDPADGMNDMDRFQETLRVLAETPRAHVTQDVESWRRCAYKNTRVWMRRNSTSCGRGRCAQPNGLTISLTPNSCLRS